MDEKVAKESQDQRQKIGALLDTQKRADEQHKNQFYITPESLVLAQLRMLNRDLDKWPERILDAGFGYGVYGRMARQLWPQAHIVGIDIEVSRLAVMSPESALCYNELVTDNFLTYMFDKPFDIVIGNPPYKEVAEKFVHRAHAVAIDGGHISLLMPAAFGHTGRRWENLYSNGMMYYREAKVVPRVSFVGYGGGTAPTEYSVWHWRKGQGDMVYAQSCKLGWDKSRQDGQRELI